MRFVRFALLLVLQPPITAQSIIFQAAIIHSKLQPIRHHSIGPSLRMALAHTSATNIPPPPSKLAHLLLPQSIDALSNLGCLIRNEHLNKDSGFSLAERKSKYLTGLLPSDVEDIVKQVKRCLLQCRDCKTNLDKYIYLLDLKANNETLFYRLLSENLFELLPIVYTPTVGEACQKFCEIYRSPHGLYVSKDNKGHMLELLDNWSRNHPQVSLIVVSDGSRILGLGDLGANGMGISVGKATLYVAAGGFHPATTMPVIMDTGTNNEGLLNHALYMGKRHKRMSHKEFYEIMDEFLMAVQAKWPKCLVQFEDFSNDHCFDVLEKYRSRLLCFNDDIQGTGAVIAAGFLNAIKITKIPNPRDLRVLFLGAGSAGIGVADQIGRALQHRHGMTPEECKRIFYMIDSKGLITKQRGDFDSLASFKKPYVRETDSAVTDVLATVKQIKPHAIIGLSGQGGQFNDEVLKTMGELNERPIVFSLSNPTTKSECTAEAAFRQTNGRVVFASGSPFPTVQVPTSDGGTKTLQPSQGNNMYVFPGLGFGAVLCGAKEVSDGMLTAATIALADCVTEAELNAGITYPPLENVRSVSSVVAGATMERAILEGVSEKELPADVSAAQYAIQHMYAPQYHCYED
eukprot:GHVQ01032600.1.p1 GENE.GHVQ01032600.1~~GHVQ01032600.1.p1  ORF type:complete len:630 (+),score=68.71 GHVQ01032600.1:161-2050(+)